MVAAKNNLNRCIEPLREVQQRSSYFISVESSIYSFIQFEINTVLRID